MAKKFSLITGLHNVYELGVNETYDVNNVIYQYAGEISNNTIVFAIADLEDNSKYIGSHKISEGEKYIIAQNEVFAMLGSSSNDSMQNTWRPVVVNGETMLYNNDFTPLRIEDGSFVNTNMVYSSNSIALRFDIDIDAIKNAIQSFPYDGELSFYKGTNDIYTNNPNNTDNTAKLTNNTINISGSFSANAKDDTTVTIAYTGNADRVDWYVANDTRNEDYPNNASGKKYVYAEPLQDFFEPNGFPGVDSIKASKKSYIAEDSIVFITCGEKPIEGSSTVLKDSDVFKNPEYRKGSRWIWTHGKMFSCNTWGPIFVSNSGDSNLYEVTPTNTSDRGGKLVFEGTGGITLDNSVDTQTGLYKITIDGTNLIGQGGSGASSLTTKQIFVAEDINIANTGLAKLVIADGTFEGNKVPKGMSLHEVLTRLLYMEQKEDFGTQKKTASMSITNKAITFTIKNASTGAVIKSGDYVPVGTKLSISISYAKTGSQTVTITGFVGGYQEGTNTPSTSKTYSKTFTPVLNNEHTESIPTSQLVKGTDGNYTLTGGMSGNNPITKCQINCTNKVTINSETFNDILVYPISNLGNKGTTPISISKSDYAKKTEETSANFVINYMYPRYIGYYKETDTIAFESDSVDNDTKVEFIEENAKQFAPYYGSALPASTVIDTPNNALGEECRQIYTAIPKYMLKNTSEPYFEIKDALGDSWYNPNAATTVGGISEIIMHGIPYVVWHVRGKTAKNTFADDKFTITY